MPCRASLRNAAGQVIHTAFLSEARHGMACISARRGRLQVQKKLARSKARWLARRIRISIQHTAHLRHKADCPVCAAFPHPHHSTTRAHQRNEQLTCLSFSSFSLTEMKIRFLSKDAACRQRGTWKKREARMSIKYIAMNKVVQRSRRTLCSRGACTTA